MRATRSSSSKREKALPEVLELARIDVPRHDSNFSLIIFRARWI